MSRNRVGCHFANHRLDRWYADHKHQPIGKDCEEEVKNGARTHNGRTFPE
ncbi:Uncharacterised protein [Vibrio cholerae]|nr:Uncharacterised protein [Vibrio cholerae]